MSDDTQGRMSAWLNSQALAVLSRLVTLVLIPVVMVAGGKLLQTSERVAVIERQLVEKERRLSAVEAQASQAELRASAVRADLAAAVSELQATRRDLDRILRLLERRADAGRDDLAQP